MFEHRMWALRSDSFIYTEAAFVRSGADYLEHKFKKTNRPVAVAAAKRVENS